MIGHASTLMRRGSTSSSVLSAKGTFGRIGISGGSSSASPLLASSSVSNRLATSDCRKRYQSTLTAALHPTAPASSAVDTSSSSASGSTSYQYEPLGTIQSKRSRTRLPTPLPPGVAEQRNQELRKRTRDNQNQRKGKGIMQQDKDADFPHPASGSLSAATLQSLNENDSFFTSSQTIESIANLRACLSTGLTQRAAKIFQGMREEALDRSEELSSWVPRRDGGGATRTPSSAAQYMSPLSIRIYNAMLGSYLRKAWQMEDSVRDTGLWVRRAWELLDEMARGRPNTTIQADPLPDKNTFAVMAKGLVRLMRGNRLPNNQQNLTNLLQMIRRSGFRLNDIVFSSVFTSEEGEMESFGVSNMSREGEPDAKMVLQSLGPVVAELGDVVLSMELDGASRVLQGLDSQATQAAMEEGKASGSAEVIPELRPVTNYQKRESDEAGEVNFNLKVLRENLSIVQEAKQSSSDPYERQRWLEFGAMDAAKKRFEEGESHLGSLGLLNAGSLKQKDLQRWMWSWYKKLTKALEEDIGRISSSEGGPRSSSPTPSKSLEWQLLPFLQLLPPDKLAMVAILELMRMQGSGSVGDGMKTASALVTIGKAIEREHYTEQLRKRPEFMAKTRQAQTNLWQGGITSLKLRHELRRQMAKEAPNEDESLGWSSNIRVRVGSFVVQHLMNVATVKRSAVDRDGVHWEEDQPAFYSAYQYIQGKRLGVIRLNEVVSKRLSRDMTIETLHPRHLPMLVPPKPWFTHDTGGYYSVKTSALRYKDDFEQGSYLRAASANGSLESVFAGLDVLGSTAWTINDDVFKVVMEVWNSGKGLAEVPALELAEEEPARPDNYETDLRARANYLYAMKSFNLRKLANHSQRCDVNYRLEIARAFMGEKFFFPHNMDFRGRAYPLPPHLNHIGNDLSRGLLMFAEPKPLGSVGLRWLRIHLANVYGFDKASFTEREQFAIDHEQDIRNSARDPLGEGNWWLQADDPWQCLATCKELQKAQDYSEGPEKYPSRMPVHQDGTCNGLQHYAALGGDMAGAKQVNLSSGDRPSDVYTAVADLVIEVVERDAKDGNETAKMLQGKVTRKVVKQTVMTTVYGVTFVGAKNQVARQLEDRGMANESIWVCSTYLAKQIMACIGDLFSGAEAIQSWLTDCVLLVAKSIPPERLEEVKSGLKSVPTVKTAQQLSKEQMTAVIWTTPLGLPVVQPYRKQLRRQVATSIQSVYIHDPYLATQVSPAKQASAFPPNFIHSLDATHMILTALECQSAKLTFASVHDSYWTHACDIETMSDIIRETFVRLHSSEILHRLKEEFLDRYKGYIVPVKVARERLARRQKLALKKMKTEEENNGNVLVEETEDGALKAKLDPVMQSEKLVDESEVEDIEAAVEEEVEDAAAVSSKGVEGDAASHDAGPDFVALKDILPDIPKKGSFDVNEIKRSLYFFS